MGKRTVFTCDHCQKGDPRSGRNETEAPAGWYEVQATSPSRPVLFRGVLCNDCWKEMAHFMNFKYYVSSRSD